MITSSITLTEPSNLYSEPQIAKAISLIQENYRKRLDTLTHELKNTLSLTRLSMEWIEQMHPEVSQFHYWPQVMNDLQYLCQMLAHDALYEASPAGTPEQFSLNPFLQEIAASCMPWFEQTDTQFSLSLTDEPVFLFADPLRLRQSLLNLLKNALEAVSGSGCIILSSQKEGDYIRITVADNGSGVPPQMRQSLFAPHASGKEGGRGLGLFTSKRMIEAMNGSLTYRPAAGKGSLFSIRLPLVSSEKE